MGLMKRLYFEQAEKEREEDLKRRYPDSDDPELDEALDQALEKDD